MSDFDVEVQCPACGTTLTVPRIRRGATEKCPVCATAVPIPGGQVWQEDSAEVSAKPAQAVPPAAQRAGPRAEVPPSALCAVCSWDEQTLNVFELQPIIRELTRWSPAEVSMQISRGMGVLAEPVPAQVARAMVSALGAKGVSAFAVPLEGIPRFEREVPRICVYGLSEEALVVQTDLQGTIKSLPWRAVVAGFCSKLKRVRGGPTQLRLAGGAGMAPFVAYGGVGMYGMRTTTRYQAVKRPPEPDAELTVLLRGRSGGIWGLRATERQVRYAYLESRMKPTRSQNFLLFLNDVVARCPRAFFPPRTVRTAGGDLKAATFLKVAKDYEKYKRWVLCCVAGRELGAL